MSRVRARSGKDDLVMSDVQSVIALLCKHLDLSVGCSVKPEYFRLAKYNTVDDNVTRALRTVLYVLSRQAVKDIAPDIDFDRYAHLQATKLYFAFLQYPTIEFYALSPKDNSCNRELLLALGWLLATNNVLNTAIRRKLATSVPSQEYSGVGHHPDTGIQEKIENRVSSDDTKSRMNEIVHGCGRINHNAKEIAELAKEKIKLTTKIHAATSNTRGLPYLSVSEVSSTKNSRIDGEYNVSKRNETKSPDQDLNSLAEILEIHAHWNEGQRFFYDWMVTVIEENKNDESNDRARAVRCDNVSNFLSLLRHVTKKKIHSTRTNERTRSTEATSYEESCCSRYYRTERQSTETESWSSQTDERLRIVESDAEITMKKLTSELRRMLRSIPNSVEI